MSLTQEFNEDVAFKPNMKDWLKNWMDKAKSKIDHLPSEDYKHVFQVKTTTAKIRRMSKRRRKIAMVKRRYLILTGVYPIFPKVTRADDSIFEMTFEYESRT